MPTARSVAMTLPCIIKPPLFVRAGAVARDDADHAPVHRELQPVLRFDESACKAVLASLEQLGFAYACASCARDVPQERIGSLERLFCPVIAYIDSCPMSDYPTGRSWLILQQVVLGLVAGEHALAADFHLGRELGLRGEWAANIEGEPPSLTKRLIKTVSAAVGLSPSSSAVLSNLRLGLTSAQLPKGRSLTRPRCSCFQLTANRWYQLSIALKQACFCL